MGHFRMPPVSWQRLHQEQFLYEEGCWNSCEGFCCSNNHPDFAFQLLPIQGTTIIYLEEEYRWLAQHGRVPGPEAGPANVLSFDFGGPEPLAVVHTTCRLLGQCHGVIDKPLLCKLYPMLPVIGIDGELEDVCAASIFELTMEVLGLPTPCTVAQRRPFYLRHWRLQKERLAALRHPYLVLYLRAAKHLADIYADRLRASTALRGLAGKELWQRWEWEYLSGRLIDPLLLARHVKRTYDALAAEHGQFLPTAA